MVIRQTVVALFIGASVLLSGCAGTSQSTVTRAAAAQEDSMTTLGIPADKLQMLTPNDSVRDCGSFWTSDTSYQTVYYISKVSNATGNVINLHLATPDGVDCYDWGNRDQPELLNGANLNAQIQAVGVTLHLRNSTESSGSVRPWELSICTDIDFTQGVGWQQLCGQMSPRSFFAWTPVRCAQAILTLCDGMSLCSADVSGSNQHNPANDYYYSELSQQIQLKGTVDHQVHATLTATTSCVPLEDTSYIVLGGTV